MRRRRPPRRLLPRRIALVEPDLERSHAAILARPYHGRYPSFTLMRIGRYTSFTLMRMRMSRSSISCRVVEAPAALRGRSCTTTRLPPPSWAPAHAQPAGTRQNRHRLMSSSFPRVWLRRAQSDLSAPSPPRSPTSAINFIRAAGAVFDLELAALLGNGATLAAAVHDKVVAWFDLRYDAAGRKVRGKPHV